ncbi:polyphosphate kinase 1 [Pedobacter sp. GR22-6]|uniref:polyphosphate kinase 1 n=1 Tax=Pedobacter sp. GR22-6 TaxID=3127957 RepID=UPI00307D635B
MMRTAVFFNRDLSWLSFNERVLLEAASQQVPILERIKFLSIYSSNLDEFYRVRIPVLMALNDFHEGQGEGAIYEQAKVAINRQQKQFGEVISGQILPALEASGIHWIYKQSIPLEISEQVNQLFFTEVLAYIHSECIDNDLTGFFAENNKLYQVVILKDGAGTERMELINIPSDVIPRFYAIQYKELQYVVFLEDIIKYKVNYLFPNDSIIGIYNLKITRDAELKIDDKEEDISVALERQLETRDFGFATRFLYEPGIPLRNLYRMIYALDLQQASVVEGGTYHNLKDLSGFPLSGSTFSYEKWPAILSPKIAADSTLFSEIQKRDILINVPYQQYDPILRFFNEAANDPEVLEIYTTLYRVANSSRIVSALITAARNGKRVVVMVELKARFDEANNIKWAKKMKAAGVKIVYSSISLKVHAKVALIRRKEGEGISPYLGLLATGNLNETTAKFYTDQILLTAHQPMLEELQQLFGFLKKSKKTPSAEDQINFKYLLVAQFNLQDRFLELIQREIDHAKAGIRSGITIKLNNLEEQILINKLYEASCAGVEIKLIIRGICCLVPGVEGLSERISVIRIVDRYLEHGRIFIFDNGGNTEIFMGSADWMNRNIYSRIEVCFPLYDEDLKRIVMKIINLQLHDDAQKSIYVFLQEHLK